MANEVRLIDANAVDYENIMCSQSQLHWLNAIIEQQPTIDPESLRPKGRWVYDDGNLEWACSECLRAAHVNLGSISGYILSDFCPNCGAKMEG